MSQYQLILLIRNALLFLRTHVYSASSHLDAAVVIVTTARNESFTLNYYVRTTAGQEDPFELDSNLLLSSGRHGEDRKRQYIQLYDHETPLLDDLADLLY